MSVDADLATGRILVIDDEKSVRVLLEKILTNAGMDVYATGEPELASYFCEEYQAEVVILDVNMPKIGGIKVCEKLRSIHPNLPIIMLTGQTDSSICQKTISTGANDFITKPVDAGQVLIRVKNALQMRHLQKALSQQTEKVNLMASKFDELDHEVHDLPELNEAKSRKQQLSDIVGDYLADDFEDEEFEFLCSPAGDQ